MEINKENLQKIAHLSRLEVKKEEEDSLLSSLQSIVNWVDQLNEMDTDGVEPLRVMSQEITITRKDIAENNLKTEDALKLAPQVENQHFVVPKVIN